MADGGVSTDVTACLLRDIDGSNSGRLRLRPSHAPIFKQALETDFDFDQEINSGLGLAIDLANGQPDLDRTSALLRVQEAKTGRDDGRTRLIAFRFPDLASLAEPIAGLTGSPRLFALAFDEERLQDTLPSDDISRPAPLIYARARIIADGRKLGCPVYLKPRWSDVEALNDTIIAHAIADGFDGLIGPLEMAARIKNM